MLPGRARGCQGVDHIAKPFFRPGPGSSVRLVDVARVARVAPITVSRALRDPGKVSPETRARVERAVAETG